jgi:E3 SUMO-protein ligase NSE2
LKDFYDDQLIIRKMQRMEKAAAQAADEDDDEEDEDPRPRGTQRSRPTQIEDDDSDGIEDGGQERKKTITRVKREKQKSLARAASPDDEEADTVDMDAD